MEFQIIAGELCLDFINTLDNRPTPGRWKELLPTYADVVEWAAQAGAISERQKRGLLRTATENLRGAESVRQKAIELRECLHRLLVTSLQRQCPLVEDLAVYNRYLKAALAHLELQQSGRGFQVGWEERAGQLESVLWPIVKSAHDLLTSEDLGLVRECDSASCRWLFLDRSKNHSRRWCDMSVCGNRVKAQRFYQRKGTSAARRMESA